MNLETLYHRRSFFGAFSLHIQSCRQLHSFILRLKSLEKSLSDNIKIIVTAYLITTNLITTKSIDVYVA